MNSVWRISVAKAARKQLASLSREVQQQIADYLQLRVAGEPDPRRLGKALTRASKSFRRYYRIICQLGEKELLIVAIKTGHRRDVYR